MLSPSLARRLSWLALPLALVGAVVAARLHLTRAAHDGALPPAEPEALRSWLEQRAPPVDRPALSPEAWSGLAGQPALAVWARVRVDPEGLSPAAARGLAAHAVPPRVLRALGPRSGLDAEALAVLLDPALADRVAAACPGLDATLRRPLCDARPRAESGRDAALVEALAHPDADLALWAVELASGLGDAGARIGEAASRGAVGGASGDRTRAHALVVLARTLPGPAAVARLSRHLDAADPLAPLAVLELSRLADGEAALGGFAVDSPDPGLAALAEVGRARAADVAPRSGGGLLDRGL